MIRSPRRLALTFATIGGLFLAACSGDASGSEPTATAAAADPRETTTAATAQATAATAAPRESTPAPPPEAGSAASPRPEADSAASSVDRVAEHIDALSGEIGIRSAGTEAERDAANYIAGVLEAAGYATTIEPFAVSTNIDGSEVGVDGDDVAVRPFMMNGSATSVASGPLVYGALGAPEDLAGLDVDGRVLLLDRGILTFGQKVRNAELAGAAAVIVANNEPGIFSGSLGGRPAAVPVVAISQQEGALLRPLADAGATATVRAAIDTLEGESQNVVGRSGDLCRFYIGGHYDAVPVSPGANDNASGTAMILELARVHRVDGLCVVAFGAEEIGLVGSQAYVAAHDLKSAIFMLNFDVVGLLDGAIVIGDRALSDLLLAATDELPIRSGRFPAFASSDHVSFLNAGIPAVTITSGNDAAIHTPGDDIAHLSREALTTMLEVGDRVMQAALSAAG